MRVQKKLKNKILSLITTVTCLIIALSCFILPALAAAGENEDNALMVGVPADRCPVFYQDADTGEIVGIGVDLMRAVAENAGYDVSFIRVVEPTLKEALDNEAYDVVMPFGSAVPSASGKQSIVTDNLIQTPFTLVTEENRNLPQLNELHVGMLHSLAAGAETVKQLYPGMEIALYGTMPECVKALRADFKFINDSLGRAAGDDLLRFWANRTLATFSDEEAMGRVTADRFVVLRRNGGDKALRKDDQEVLGPVRTYFMDRGKENRVLLCGGVYVVTSTDRQQINIDRMMDCARMAERKVRDTRNEGYAFYNPEQWEKGKQVADIINHLPAAIKSGGLHVWYQPQVNYETRKITGAEALCRWDHNKLGFLYPSNFIAVLEESGLIYDLDCYVWDKVCQDLHRWNEQGCHRSISVNVSRCDIREDRDIPGQFSRLIQKYGITPDQLRIEITETAFAENPDLLISNTNKLRELGFQVEMDDFGSGYSSLHMLKEVPVDRIKLDLHFLTSSGDQKKSRTIVGCMIQMVELLEMKMIAEGVETVEQAEFLRNRGCPEMQGYYFFDPMPVEEFEKLSEEI